MLEDVYLPEGYVDVSFDIRDEGDVPVVSIRTEPEHYPPEVDYGAKEASWEAFKEFGAVEIRPLDEGAEDYALNAFRSVIAGYWDYKLNPFATLRDYLGSPEKFLDLLDPRRSRATLEKGRVEEGYRIALTR